VSVDGRIAEPPVVATPAALDAIARMVAQRGPLMLFQSGGCCDGSLPICFDAGELIVGDHDVLLGELGGCPFYTTSVNTRCGSTPSSSWTSVMGSPKGSLSRRGTANTSSQCPASVRPASPEPDGQRADRSKGLPRK